MNKFLSAMAEERFDDDEEFAYQDTLVKFIQIFENM